MSKAAPTVLTKQPMLKQIRGRDSGHISSVGNSETMNCRPCRENSTLVGEAKACQGLSTADEETEIFRSGQGSTLISSDYLIF